MCKKHTLFLLLTLGTIFTPALLSGQGDCPAPAIHGNYEQGEAGESFQVKVYMNFIEYSDYEWIDQQEADIRAKRALDYLNSVYNEYGIYFITPGAPCGENIANLLSGVDPGLQTIAAVRQSVTGGAHTDGIDIYFRGDNYQLGGNSFGFPSNYMHVDGEYDDGTTVHWAGDTPVLPHEMGHCLGLMHPNHNCNQVNPSTGSCPNGTSSDYCTGDHISDTPPTTAIITCDSLLGSNYMSVTSNPLCREELLLKLPESSGIGQAIFYNLQGNVVHRFPLSGGLNRLLLPPALFKPGIYLLKARLGGASHQLKIAIH
ncbi:MAG: hypothetical protein H6560_11840 [Lewinellaceae bacterium]|nr:hypothetical protein [Lewinellaceae bacterium]